MEEGQLPAGAMLQCAADASEDATSIDAFEKIKR